VFTERLDRQLRIEGWNQAALAGASIGVVGDADLLTPLYLVSAAALGLNRVVVIAPELDGRFLNLARRINPVFDVQFIEGYYTHPALGELFTRCTVIVDLSRYALANKLLLDKGFEENIPILRGLCFADEDEQGCRVFAYRRGREWQELEEVLSPYTFPRPHGDDGVLDVIAAGLVLEQTKNTVLGWRVSPDVIRYQSRRTAPVRAGPRVCVVGAGALGNFVGLGLALSGFRQLTFMDPDVVEATNLNRQILLSDGIGRPKAEVLSASLNTLFGTDAAARVTYCTSDTDISAYDVVFDCVDNFETRIVLSEKCALERKILISGGSSVESGQVVVYNPEQQDRTPAELLGLYDIVDRRAIDTYHRARESCVYQPDPSVITTNQIIAGLMVDACRMLLEGQQPENVFYDSTRSTVLV
jgi:hypothetical protein